MELKLRHSDGESLEIDFDEEDFSISDAIREFSNWAERNSFTSDISLTLSEGGIPLKEDSLFNMVLAGFAGLHVHYSIDKWAEVLEILSWFYHDPDDLGDEDVVRALHHLTSQTEQVRYVTDRAYWEGYCVYDSAEEAGKEYEEGYSNCPLHLEEYIDWEQVGLDHSSTYELDGTTYYVLN